MPDGSKVEYRIAPGLKVPAYTIQCDRDVGASLRFKGCSMKSERTVVGIVRLTSYSQAYD